MKTARDAHDPDLMTTPAGRVVVVGGANLDVFGFSAGPMRRFRTPIPATSRTHLAGSPETSPRTSRASAWTHT